MRIEAADGVKRAPPYNEPMILCALALLGGSFINRFGYSIDTSDGILTLHRIGDDKSRK